MAGKLAAAEPCRAEKYAALHLDRPVCLPLRQRPWLSWAPGRAHTAGGASLRFTSQASTVKRSSPETTWHRWPWVGPQRRCHFPPGGEDFSRRKRRSIMTAIYWMLTALCSLSPLSHTAGQGRSSFPPFPEEETEAQSR